MRTYPSVLNGEIFFIRSMPVLLVAILPLFNVQLSSLVMTVRILGNLLKTQSLHNSTRRHFRLLLSKTLAYRSAVLPALSRLPVDPL